jgi:hypothetical protein
MGRIDFAWFATKRANGVPRVLTDLLKSACMRWYPALPEHAMTLSDIRVPFVRTVTMAVMVLHKAAA